MLERENVGLLKIAEELFIRLNPALWPSSYYSQLCVRNMHNRMKKTLSIQQPCYSGQYALA